MAYKADCSRAKTYMPNDNQRVSPRQGPGWDANLVRKEMLRREIEYFREIGCHVKTRPHGETIYLICWSPTYEF